MQHLNQIFNAILHDELFCELEPCGPVLHVAESAAGPAIAALGGKAFHTLS